MVALVFWHLTGCQPAIMDEPAGAAATKGSMVIMSVSSVSSSSVSGSVAPSGQSSGVRQGVVHLVCYQRRCER